MIDKYYVNIFIRYFFLFFESINVGMGSKLIKGWILVWKLSSVGWNCRVGGFERVEKKGGVRNVKNRFFWKRV